MENRNRAWVEVRASSIVENYRRIAMAAGADARLIPMVKADGYGLGAVRVCRLLSPLGPAAFGVASVSGGAALREAGVRERIIVFTPLAPGEEGGAVAAGLEVVAGDPDSIRRATEAGLDFHLELDTGMGRAGWPAQTAEADLRDAAALRTAIDGNAGWRGIFTHFHSADESGAPESDLQLDRFVAMVKALAPPATVELHTDNSAGALRGAGRTVLAELAGRLGCSVLVRPGIHLYGGGSGPDLPAATPWWGCAPGSSGLSRWTPVPRSDTGQSTGPPLASDGLRFR